MKIWESVLKKRRKQKDMEGKKRTSGKPIETMNGKENERSRLSGSNHSIVVNIDVVEEIVLSVTSRGAKPTAQNVRQQQK